MSFILDALKKSETDRQRQSGPALFEVKVAPPKSALPIWAIAVGVLLIINMIVVGWFLLRRTAHQDATTVAATDPANPAPAVAAAPRNVAPAPTPPPTPVPSATTAPAPTQPMPQSAPPVADERTPGTSEPTLGTTNLNAAHDQAVNSGENPDDYAPAAEPDNNTPFKGRVRRGTDSGYTLYQDAAAAPGSNLPPLRLDLHVFAARPQDRFALINMHRLREGDSLPEGVRVESITPEGVVMSHNGAKFLLPRD